MIPRRGKRTAVLLAIVGLATWILGLGVFLDAVHAGGTTTFDAPRLMRYVSSAEGRKGLTCYGLVVREEEGIPLAVRDLTDFDPGLCYREIPDNADAEPALMRRGLAAAEAAWQKKGDTSDQLEHFDRDRLAELVKPPVRITQEQLDFGQRFVLGAGLNYAMHQREVGRDEELLLFPKAVAPTGAYGPVIAGLQIGEAPPESVLLLDYEVELAFVLLQDVDLSQPVPGYLDFLEQVAFFSANDVSDREPIILDPETGYTRGKSHPTYLPLGPWMVHGRYLKPRTDGEGSHSLRLLLTVRESNRQTGQKTERVLQNAVTQSMIHGPREIIQILAERYRQGDRICMRDPFGMPRYVHDANGIIPAGSIVLTGTPGGTAIQEPGLWQRISLFFQGGFSIEGAKRHFIESTEQRIDATDYLEPGDQVETWVQYPGKQIWEVVEDKQRKPYGVDAPGACSARE